MIVSSCNVNDSLQRVEVHVSPYLDLSNYYTSQQIDAIVEGIKSKVVYLSDNGCVSDAGDLSIEKGVGAIAGTLNTAAIQAVLDLAITEPLTVVVDGQYNTGALTIYSNTTLIFKDDCGFILANGTNTDMFRNFNFAFSGTRLDKNIAILGGRGVFNLNAANQSPRNPTLLLTFKGAFRLAGVERIVFEGGEYLYASEFTNSIMNCKDIYINGSKIDVGTTNYIDNKDGFHFNGPCENIVINNIQLKTGDDGIALNADEGLTTDCPNIGGAITNVSINNMKILDGGAKGIRLLSGTSLIDNVSITNVKGNTKDFFLIADNLRGGNMECTHPGAGNFGRISIDGINVEVTEATNSTQYLSYFSFSGTFKDLSLKNIIRNDFSQGQNPAFNKLFPLIEVQNTDLFGKSSFGSLTIDGINCNIDDNDDQPALVKIYDVEVKNLSLTNFNIANNGGKMQEGLHIAAICDTLIIDKIAIGNSFVNDLVLSGAATAKSLLINGLAVEDEVGDASIAFSPVVDFEKSIVNNVTSANNFKQLKTNLANPSVQYPFTEATGADRLDVSGNNVTLVDVNDNVELIDGRGTAKAVRLQPPTQRRLLGDFSVTDNFSCYFEYRHIGEDAINILGTSSADNNRGWNFIEILDVARGVKILQFQSSFNGDATGVTPYNFGLINDGEWNKIGFSFERMNNVNGLNVWVNGTRQWFSGVSFAFNTGKLNIGYGSGLPWDGADILDVSGLVIFNNYLMSETDYETLANGEQPYQPKAQLGASLANNTIQSVTNATTSVLTESQLNTTYPDAQIGMEVICPSISGGGLIYKKYSTTWVKTSITTV